MEFPSLVGVHTGEEARVVVEAEEEAALVVGTMVAVEVMTGEVVVQTVEALVDHMLQGTVCMGGQNDSIKDACTHSAIPDHLCSF